MSRVRIHVIDDHADMDEVCEGIEDCLLGVQPEDRTWLLVDFYKVTGAILRLLQLGYRFDREDRLTKPAKTQESDISLQEFLEIRNAKFFRDIQDMSWQDLWQMTKGESSHEETPFAFPNVPTWKAHDSLNATRFTHEYAYDLVVESSEDFDLAEKMRAWFQKWVPSTRQADGTYVADVDAKQLNEVDWLHLAGIWTYIIQKTEANYPHLSLEGKYPGLILQEDDLSFTEAIEEAGGEMPSCRECFRAALVHLLFDGERCWWCEDCYWELIEFNEDDRVRSEEELDALDEEKLRDFVDWSKELRNPEKRYTLLECHARGVALQGFSADFPSACRQADLLQTVAVAQGNPEHKTYYVIGDGQKLHAAVAEDILDIVLCYRHGVSYGEGIYECPQCLRRYCECCFEASVCADPQFPQETEPLCPECHALRKEQI